MIAWDTSQWAIVLLAFLIGLFVGLMFCSGRKWKRRYHEESVLRQEDIRRREALEAERKHWEAQNIAARARDDRTPPPPKTRT
jgi:uncharacterized membrane-anchored protein YhcB (DUF1043 family)